MKYQNPIISGFFPDPSICRVDDTFYLVCSSFQFFPGVPLFESKDLLNWSMIGHVLTRESQLPLAKTNSTGGIYAPTIRFYNNRFYMVTTNVTNGGNFYVYTDDIYGEWSEPIFVEQGGIDPSLYFENDKAYFMSNGTDDNGVEGITQCEIDIDTGKKLSPSISIWNGTGGRFLESPHLYKINNAYYLMASEGGTEYGHMVVYAKGDSIFGPFKSYQNNPVLTNRNLGGYIIQGCGHADLVDDINGNWWMVHLGFRQIDKWVMHHITGREVYLVPVTFDSEGWFSAGENGTTLEIMETNRIDEAVIQTSWTNLTFENTTVGKEWCFLQNPHMENYKFNNDSFMLKSSDIKISDFDGSPTFICIRQKEMNFTLSCDITISAHEGGISFYINPDQHYDLLVRKAKDSFVILKRRHIGDMVLEDNIIVLPENEDVTVKLVCEATNFNYNFKAYYANQEFLLGSAQTKFLSTEVAGNFTGVTMGLFAQNTCSDESQWVIFKNFVIERLNNK